MALAACAEPGEGDGPWSPRPAAEHEAETCPAVGAEPGIELCDRAWNPVEQPAYEVARRWQGEVTLFAPLLFVGLEGGTETGRLELRLTDRDGTTLARRRSDTFVVPCQDGLPAADWLEVFFGRWTEPTDFDGVSAVLTAELELGGRLLTDSVQATLTAQ